VLICEVGESERALTRLLPELPLAWVEFKVGQMGVFVAECRDLVTYHPRIRQLADARDPGVRPEAASAASSGLF
jgi:ribosomal protein L3 glutamine methyltransferase